MRTEDTAYGRNYWETYDDGKGYTDSPVWEDTAHIVKELFGYDEMGQDRSSGTRLIDIGCAMGYLVKHVRRRGIESFGLDISHHAITHADKSVRRNVSTWDFALPHVGPFYGWRQFEIVTCLETLEHIRPLTTDVALSNLRNLWTLEGGVGFFAICVLENECWETDPTHINMHSRAWWTDTLKSRGFTIDKEAGDWVRTFSLYREHEGVFVVSGVPDPEPVPDVLELES